MKSSIIIFCLMLLTTAVADARDQNQVRKFRSSHPCPVTGLTTGACTGWVVDHIIPLCLGGPDEPRNMQWQLKSDSYLKDSLERETCRRVKCH